MISTGQPSQVADPLMTYDSSGNPLTGIAAGTGKTESAVWDDDCRTS